jgi:hypothetical protein
MLTPYEEEEMKNNLLRGIAITITLVIQSMPTSAQRVCGPDHPCASHTNPGAGPVRTPYPAQTQYLHHDYARGQVSGYGVGAGAAALATGALIGGAIAAQNPAETYPVYSEPGYGYSDVSESGSVEDFKFCSKLRWTCEHQDELGLQGAGTCRRYREMCR